MSVGGKGGWSAAVSSRGGADSGSGAKAFTFGKHNGKSFEEVMNSESGYCDWVIKIESPTGAMKAFADFLRSKGKGGGTSGSGSNPSQAPSYGAAPSAAQFGQPARSEGGGPVLVCEMVQDHKFRVSAEGAVPSRQSSRHLPGAARDEQREVPFMPGHIWRELASQPGARAAADRKGFLFPMGNYEAVLARLDLLGCNVDPIPSWVRELVDRGRNQKGDRTVDESRVPSGLLPYQLEGLRFGVSRQGRCLIGDEMGLGKTLQALAVAAQYPEEWPVLVVCPPSLRLVWKEQILQWLPELAEAHDVQVVRKGSDTLNPKCKFWLISYQLLAGTKAKENFHERPNGTPHSFVIVDESHNIKEWKAARTKALMPVLRAAKRVIMLSGTPTRNSADELHPQLCGVLPWMPAKYGEFRARYCLQQQSLIGGGKTVSKIVGVRNAAELNYLLTSTVMVRRLKKEVLTELPDLRRQRVPIEVSDAKLLKEIRGKMQVLTDAIDGGTVGPGGTTATSTLFQKMALGKLPAIKEYLEEVLERGDEKVIVFAHHKLVMDALSELLAKNLAKEGLNHVRVDGSTSLPKRQEYVKKFQEDETCRVALLSITACSEGITLTAAGLVIFAELYWVPGVVEQAEARAHRIGSKHSRVVVEFLVLPDSPDEHIYRSLNRKKKDTSHMLNGAAESLNVVSELRSTPTARKRARSEAAAGADGEPGASAGDEATPPPVSRAKVNSLLAAARAGAKEHGL
mmetsp:Transcript_86283/g.243119  ORF Transcript_86283/g.243119 Transcript_86283/m.243119 type:complete len:741 (+) Transcript_86283:59-2281(+)